jgi:hypothetical protein
MLRRDQFHSSAWRPTLRGAGLDERKLVIHALRHFPSPTCSPKAPRSRQSPATSGGHREDRLPGLRALAPGPSGRARRRARPGAAPDISGRTEGATVQA